MSDLSNTYQGIVYKKSTGHYWVNAGEETIVCSISSKLRRELIYPIKMHSKPKYMQKVMATDDIHAVDPVAIGDMVEFVEAEESGTDNRSGMILNVLPRKSKLTRGASGKKPLEQVVVANLDQIVAVLSCAQPKPKWGMLDRYLVSAESCEVPAVICMTKFDLVKGNRAEAEILKEVEYFRSIGYTVLVTSADDGTGLEDFKLAIGGKMSALVGMSGVGKTSILNAIQPGLGLRVNEVNTNIDKGRHTTTHLEMFPLDMGGAIVDTPGMKVFGLWESASEDIQLLFREMASYAGKCRFGFSCSHEHEPSCAIKRAVEDGMISPRRYKSFLAIREHPEAEAD